MAEVCAVAAPLKGSDSALVFANPPRLRLKAGLGRWLDVVLATVSKGTVVAVIAAASSPLTGGIGSFKENAKAGFPTDDICGRSGLCTPSEAEVTSPLTVNSGRKVSAATGEETAATLTAWTPTALDSSCFG